ncbi:hypothetical protein [Bifidobacterium olomucense]|uniref:Uncharacterized protein n=1 Tax=Bifidobacterium olomucense TaxID=2675324 RepID=A0A7Y0HXA7_9BIFI|nr:hypothetical protein [Bifidobacterium sp. DSM 109959]NMM98132.1 hypothetical protein [Bifidobacterium sp. DSM 109959]
MDKLSNFWDMVKTRGLADMKQTTVNFDGKTTLRVSFDFHRGEAALHITADWDSLETVAAVLRKALADYDIDAEGRRLMDGGLGIKDAYTQVSRLRNSLETVVSLADEVLNPTSSYIVTKHVTTEEWAYFEGPEGMDPEEAENWYDKNVDPCELSWQEDVIDSELIRVEEEE